MNTLFLTCPRCGHTGSTIDPKAIYSASKCQPITGRCLGCGYLGKVKTTLSYDARSNPLVGARADKDP